MSLVEANDSFERGEIGDLTGDKEGMEFKDELLSSEWEGDWSV